MDLSPAIFKKLGLNKKQREALAWWLVDGHSYAEIALWQRCHRQVVARRVKGAIRKLERAGVTVPKRREYDEEHDKPEFVNFTDLSQDQWATLTGESSSKEADAI
jgi:predicted DNA-binding protein YlxM (UPF0122 family)